MTDAIQVRDGGTVKGNPEVVERRLDLLVVLLIADVNHAQQGDPGVGIGSLPDYMITPDRPLQRILPEIDGPTTDAYFVYPEELRNTKRIGVFRDFLEEQVQKWQF